ncbi:MAG: hypothetical protein ACK4NE_09615, partial [Albidovulum sp.]
QADGEPAGRWLIADGPGGPPKPLRAAAAFADDPAPAFPWVADDDPSPPEDVLAEAARLLGLPPPPEVAFDEAEMTPLARSFYAESKRVRNDRIKRDLGVRLTYPDYRSGLRALLAQES